MLVWMTLGFLIGLQHALEADHIAAVAALASGRTGFGRIARHGAIWGVGHGLTLAAFGGAVFALKLSLDARLSGLLELAVGVMLVGLGVRVIYRLVRDRIHFHGHRHGDGSVHFHAHSHGGETVRHVASRHDHAHSGSWRRSLAVGMMHGLAGSAAVVALTASGASEPVLGIAFMVLFGLGSTLGMAAFSAVLAVPLTLTARSLTWAHRGLQVAAAAAATGLGLHIVIVNGPVLAGIF